MRDRAERLDYLISVAVSLLTILSRVPYRARMLYKCDAAQFALALRGLGRTPVHYAGYTRARAR